MTAVTQCIHPEANKHNCCDPTSNMSKKTDVIQIYYDIPVHGHGAIILVVISSDHMCTF